MTDSPSTAANSSISDHGARIAASRLGITVADYREHESRDEHWCPRCCLWLPRGAFGANASTPRGVATYCKLHLDRDVRRARRARRSGITYAGPRYARRRVTPTARGAAVTSAGDKTTGEVGSDPDGAPVTSPTQLVPSTAASSGHLHCAPAFRHLCEGRLPAGWTREVAS